MPFSSLHAVTAEPIRVSPPKAVVYPGLINERVIKLENRFDTYVEIVKNNRIDSKRP
jgi:hypothetical protein